MDVSWDDSVLVAGTEEGTIELYNFQKIVNQAGKSQIISQLEQPKARGAQYFIKMFKTKANGGVLFTKFTWRNFLYTIGNYN